jgi:hypothetical protein
VIEQGHVAHTQLGGGARELDGTPGVGAGVGPNAPRCYRSQSSGPLPPYAAEKTAASATANEATNFMTVSL